MRNAKQVIFVDPSVEDYRFLFHGMDKSILVHLLPWNEYGVLFVEDTLRQYAIGRATHHLPCLSKRDHLGPFDA
jgi:hypothetical protein